MERRSWLVAAAVVAAVVSVARAELGRMGERLGLSPEQTEKVEAAFKAEKKAMTPLHRELRDAMIKLHDLVEDDADDSALKAAMERVHKAKQAMEAEHDKFHDRLAGLVPPKAMAKLMLAHHAGMRRGMGGGMPMGMRGHPGLGMMGHPMMPHGMTAPGMGPGRGHGGPGVQGDWEKHGPKPDADDEDDDDSDE